MLPSKNDVKYYTISFVLHALLLIGVALKGGGGNSNKNGQNNENGEAKFDSTRDGEILPKQVEITLVERAPVDGDGEVAIEKLKEKPYKPKTGNGFYGVGVTLDRFTGPIPVNYNGKTYMGIMVDEVISGNPAHIHGFHEGDVVFMVNGGEYGSAGHDLRGNEPIDLVVGIYRDGKIIFISLRRDWIDTTVPDFKEGHP